MWGILTGPDTMSCVLTFHWGLDAARAQSGIDVWHGEFDPVPRVAQILSAAKPSKVGVIGFHRVPAAALSRIETESSCFELRDADSLSLAIRRLKAPEEVACLSEAAAITERALDASISRIQPGITEREISALLAYEIRRQGGDLSFPPMVLSGGRSPVIFRLPTAYPIQVGTSVMIDVGAEYSGYQADIARTFVLGRPTPELQRAHSAVQGAHEAILESARPGVPCRSLHTTGAAVLQRSGYEVLHRMGHGVGLATSFEWPSLDTEEALLEEGMTLAIEPAVYVQGVGSVKLEDMILITRTGFSFLSRSSRELGSMHMNSVKS